MQGYGWLENVRGHFVENAQLESLSPISLHYKKGLLFQNEGAIWKIKGQFCPWPLPKISLYMYITIIFLFSETDWPIKAKFYTKHLQVEGTNEHIHVNNLGHMTKMAAMPIYGKNPSKIIFFSGTGRPISTKLIASVTRVLQCIYKL